MSFYDILYPYNSYKSEQARVQKEKEQIKQARIKEKENCLNKQDSSKFDPGTKPVQKGW